MSVARVAQRAKGVCCPPPLPLPVTRADRLAGVFKALADPTRLQILSSLAQAENPVCVCDFTAALGLSQPTISHHMATLKAAGLVESSKKGIWAYYRLRPDLKPQTRELLRLLA